MTQVAPLERGQIKDPELNALIDRCRVLGVPDERFSGILAHAPSYAKALLRAMVMSHDEGNVDHRLKEIIRLQLTRRSGDPYFARLRSAKATEAGLDEDTITAGCDDYERSKLFTEKEKWALRYADQMYMNAASVDAEFYAGMKQHYTEAQIMELGAFIALHYGMQVFMRTLKRGER
jgi:alkylhydroperoxidase family enzyme